MSAWLSRALLTAAALATLVTTEACARAERTSAAGAVSSQEEEHLFAAYSNWRRAATCATNWAPEPIAGANSAVAVGEQALRRLDAAGHGDLIARLDARHREIDSRIDWACADRGGLKPNEVARQRLENLKAASAGLAAAVDDALR